MEVGEVRGIGASWAPTSLITKIAKVFDIVRSVIHERMWLGEQPQQDRYEIGRMGRKRSFEMR